MLLHTVVALSLLAIAASTKVWQCSGASNTIVNSEVQLRPCKRLPCRLKKGTDQHITIAFTPETDIQEITNRVWAKLMDKHLPYEGVDGHSICNKIFTEDGEKASCPLKAGTKYVYKDSFPVLTNYLPVPVIIHWSLQDSNKDVVCFEVPASIFN